MKKIGVIMVISVAVLVTVALVGFLAIRAQSRVSISQSRSPALDLGITYVSITPAVAGYYGLDIDSGALVTSVASGGSAARAGIRPGDVILSLNGISVKEGGPFLRMLRACPAGADITLEVWQGDATCLVQCTQVSQ